jgi:hypothetical protein
LDAAAAALGGMRQCACPIFQQTKPVEVFLFLIRSAGLKFSVLDDKTIVVTKR